MFDNNDIRVLTPGTISWKEGQKALQEDGIRYAVTLLNSEKPLTPDSPIEDETEQRLFDEANAAISAVHQDYLTQEDEVRTTRNEITFSEEKPFLIVKETLNGMMEDHRRHSAVDASLREQQRRLKVSLTAEAERQRLTRDPIPSTTSSVVGFAIGFAGVEALVTAATFLGQVGTAGAGAAVGLALTAAATNIGGGGYLLGTTLLPRSMRSNSGVYGALLYQFLSLLMIAWLVLTNFMLGHFRSAAGDFDAAMNGMLSNPLAVGDMTGLLLVGFGLILAAIWCVKFFASQDPYLSYGNLGEQLRQVSDELSDNLEGYADVIRDRAEQGKVSLDDAIDDAVTGHDLGIQTKAASEHLAKMYLEAQEEVLAHLRDAATYRRSVIRGVLSQHGSVPAYYTEPIDLNDLKRNPLSTRNLAGIIRDMESAKKRIVKECESAKEQIENAVTQAQSMRMGEAILPSLGSGGEHV